MPTRRSLPLIAVAVLALAVSAGVWAQDGRGKARGHGAQGSQGERVEQLDERVRQAPRPRMARPEPDRPEQRNRRREDSMADSVRRIQRTTRGRIINAERVQSDGRSVNRIKVMDDRGRIRVYMDDPQQRRGPPTRDDDK